VTSSLAVFEAVICVKKTVNQRMW